MSTSITATGNDHITLLAHRRGYRDWRTLWNAPGNEHLQGQRNNPNQLFKTVGRNEGDHIFLPDVDPSDTSHSTEATYPFVVPTNPLRLRLRIQNPDFTAVANARYQLSVTSDSGAQDLPEGHTDGQGRIVVPIPGTATSARLVVLIPPPPAPAGATGPRPPVQDATPTIWQLQIGALNPILETAPDAFATPGVQQRLNNLGFSSGPIDGDRHSATTTRALSRFQTAVHLEPTGRLTLDTARRLRNLHDSANPDPVPAQTAAQSSSGPSSAASSPPVAAGTATVVDTPEDAIGHVAPSFPDQTEWCFNTLVIRPQFRITFRLGSIEELCPHAPNTAEGRMERLQVLGMFYYPLQHNQALNAFNGIAPAGAAPAVRGIWEYFKTKILNNASDADADAEIQRLLQEWVIQNGLPPAASEPVPAAGAPEENFAKLRLPGAYSLLVSWRTPALNLNRDNRAPYNNWTLGRTLYEVESRFRQDNPVLGRLPLIAKVESLGASRQWQPVPNATVFFQLRDPYALPAFDATRPVNDQFNRPPRRSTSLGPPNAAANAGPERFALREENPTGSRAPNATDPQRGNCPRDRGGVQGFGSLNDGSDVADHLFSIQSVGGFNAAHAAPAAGTVNPITRTVFFPLAQRVNDAARQHCVQAQTNSQGEAGVIFTPSRCGGDRYRLRAFLGPPTLTGPGNDGQGDLAVRADTGTLVVWRSMRISRYVQQQITGVDPTLVADAHAHTYTSHVGHLVFPRVNNETDYLRRLFVADGNNVNQGLNTLDLSFVVPAPGGFDPLPVQWARAFVEVQIDRAAQAAIPEILTNGDWENARAQAVRDGQAAMSSLGLRLDLDRLFYTGANKPATLNVDNAVVHLPMRSVSDYNGPAGSHVVAANQRIGVGGNSVWNIQRLLGSYMILGFIRSLSSNGYLPGMCIIQGAYGCTWTLIRNYPQGDYSDSSGESTDYRAGAIWAGAAAYPNAPVVPGPAITQLPWMTYGFNSNTCHEIGHTLFCLHSNPPEFANAGRHDPANSNRSVCVMSYQNCEGQFCAKCLFAQRGWNLAQLTY
jgi:hypothetical protein